MVIFWWGRRALNNHMKQHNVNETMMEHRESSSNMESDEQSVNAAKSFNCSICDKGFKRKDNAKRHEQLVHKLETSSFESFEEKLNQIYMDCNEKIIRDFNKQLYKLCKKYRGGKKCK